MTPIQHLEAVMDYILEHECDDFEENPSASHVYYHAHSFMFGSLDAREFLKKLLLECQPCGSCSNAAGAWHEKTCKKYTPF